LVLVERINGCIVVPGSDIDDVQNLGSAETGGAFTAMIGGMPAGSPGPALHEHPTTDEAFYIAEGELAFNLAGKEIRAQAGSLVFVPRGTVHTAWNPGTEDMRGIILITPGDAEHQFVEVDAG
jgi:quercetin dioxygenase-like cupin family protein